MRVIVTNDDFELLAVWSVGTEETDPITVLTELVEALMPEEDGA